MPQSLDQELLLEEARRSFDRATATRQEGDNRAQALLQLSIAVLGGGVGLASFVLGKQVLDDRGEGFLVASTGLASLLNMGAAVLFVQAYSGFTRQKVAVGPTAKEVQDRLGAGGDAKAAATALYQEEFEFQMEHSNREARLRRRGIWTLAATVLLYLGGQAAAALVSAVAA